MSVNPASPMKNINVKRVGTRGLGSITRKDNRSEISLSEVEEKKRHHRNVLTCDSKRHVDLKCFFVKKIIMGH